MAKKNVLHILNDGSNPSISKIIKQKIRSGIEPLFSNLQVDVITFILSNLHIFYENFKKKVKQTLFLE